jgi:hypothetical protein
VEDREWARSQAALLERLDSCKKVYTGVDGPAHSRYATELRLDITSAAI